MYENLSEEVRKKIRKEQSEYLKKWRANNPDKVKNHTANYWLKKVKLSEGEGTENATTKNENT